MKTTGTQFRLGIERCEFAFWLAPIQPAVAGMSVHPSARSIDLARSELRAAAAKNTGRTTLSKNRRIA
jgi:hypothetical protein